MSNTNSGPGSPQGGETGAGGITTAETVGNTADGQSGGNADGETFPRDYVEKLRSENAEHRTRANKLAAQLHTALVEATGRLENAAELAFDPEHLDDPDKLAAAIDALLEAKPYVAKRVVAGDAGQGPRGDGRKSAPESFADLFQGVR